MKYTRKILYIILLLNLSMTFLCYGDTIDFNKPIYLIKDSSGRGNKIALFIDAAKKKVIKRMDISDNNPYINLNYTKSFKTNYQGNPIYIVDSISIKGIFPEINLKHYKDTSGNYIITSLSSFHNVIISNKYAIEIF